jgi:hypothetical protein
MEIHGQGLPHGVHTSGATQRGCVILPTLIVSLLRFNRFVKPKSPIFTCRPRNNQQTRHPQQGNLVVSHGICSSIS